QSTSAQGPADQADGLQVSIVDLLLLHQWTRRPRRRIAELEECLGHRLVERHVGSNRLTALGEELCPAAEGAAAAAFERELAACDTGHGRCSRDLRIERGGLPPTNVTHRSFSRPPSWFAGRAGDQRPGSRFV